MKVAIITVTYNPHLEELIYNINTYLDQVPMIVVVDNSTIIDIQQKIGNLHEFSPKIHVISLKENLGIAKAQNVGLAYAIQKGYEYFIEIDQDSQLENNYVEKICFTYHKLTKKRKDIGAIGGIAINRTNNEAYDGIKKNTGIIKVNKTLSSGLLFSKEVVYQVGAKDEKMFIDLVDWEWCWRAQNYGYKTFIDTSTCIFHAMGEKHIKFLFFRFGIPASFRHYYAFKNSLYMFSKPYVPFFWKLLTFFTLLFKLSVYPFFLPNGKERFNYMMKGIKHFFSGKMGALNG